MQSEKSTFDLVHKAFEKSKFRWFAFIVTDKVTFSTNFTALALEDLADLTKDGVLDKILREQFSIVDKFGNCLCKKKQMFGNLTDGEGYKLIDSVDFIDDAVTALYKSRMQWVMIVVDSKKSFVVYSRVMDGTKGEIMKFVNDGEFERNLRHGANLKDKQH